MAIRREPETERHDAMSIAPAEQIEISRIGGEGERRVRHVKDEFTRRSFATIIPDEERNARPSFRKRSASTRGKRDCSQVQNPKRPAAKLVLGFLELGQTKSWDKRPAVYGQEMSERQTAVCLVIAVS